MVTDEQMRFTVSDLIAGYVTAYDEDDDAFGLRTTADSVFRVHLAANTSATTIRNFGEPYQDLSGDLRDLLVPGRYLFAYGIYYPEAENWRFEAMQVTVCGPRRSEYAFERPDWWVHQVRSIADFYLHGQFPEGTYDWRRYRTRLSLAGTHVDDHLAPDYRQETDTISRLVYGFATAYLLTGEQRFLDAAETGTEYLREHMRVTDDEAGVAYWYHGIDVSSAGERKIFASSAGDDYDAIPMYEQIYALAGPTQTFRVTGDPRIRSDIDRTVALFERCYRDRELGGYFSHLDPVTLDPRSDALGHNRARKNWNSVGDHAPAYLINALLATGDEGLEEFLVRTADTIVAHFPDDASSPFVQERFHEDWSHDRRWGWQQDNAVVGHNLKIAWNLTRVGNLRPKPEYAELAAKIARVMPAVGSDQQRGGWYDVLERRRGDGERHHRFVWHDRKAWWQQEQAILAYLVLHGSYRLPEHLDRARESAAFYNSFFLDHDDGGVYFNVQANGIPFLVGTERLKGSHSMSGYHSTELCYLAAAYTNLLIREEPLELHFRPRPDAWPDGVLRVAPDLLPPGRARLSDVWIDGEPYTRFDADAMTVTLPERRERDLTVRVRLVPAAVEFDARLEVEDGVAKIVCRGSLEADHLGKLHRELQRAAASETSCVALVVADVDTMSRAALNELLFVRGKLDLGRDVVLVGANRQVSQVVREADSPFALLEDESALRPTS